MASLATACAAPRSYPAMRAGAVGEVLELVQRARGAVPDRGGRIPRHRAGRYEGHVGRTRDRARCAGRAAPPSRPTARSTRGSRADARRRQPRAVHLGHDRTAEGRAPGPRRDGRHDAGLGDIVGLGPADRYPVVSPMSHIGGHKTGRARVPGRGCDGAPRRQVRRRRAARPGRVGRRDLPAGSAGPVHIAARRGRRGAAARPSRSASPSRDRRSSRHRCSAACS